FRRPAPARGDRPGVPEGRADPLARRSDQRARHRERGAGAGGAGAADGRAHHHHHRAPALHRAGRRPHLRALRRPGGGGRRPRPAGGPRRPLRAAGRRPEPRPRARGGGVTTPKLTPRRALKLLAREPWVQATLAWLVSAYLGLTLKTMRWRFENRAPADAAAASSEGVLACFWHGRIALAPATRPIFAKKPRRVLISNSPDGEFIAQVVRRLGFPAIRGSTTS